MKLGHIFYLTKLILVLGSLWAAPALAQNPVTPTQAMAVGNQRYEAGEYTEAIAIYEAIIASGLHNSTVYYNLGNAHFKRGDLGRAILNYRRAQQLDPRDADVAANLNLARSQTVDKLETPSEGAWVNLVELIEEWLTLREAKVVALGLWLIICVLVVTTILKSSWRRWLGLVLALLVITLAIGLVSIFNRNYTAQNYPSAVIVAAEVDVTSGPGGAGQYLVEFNLHAGAEVRVLESRLGWQRISLPGDLQGWVPLEAIEQVN
jgi:tetratricopeptide (TPR) repeat protein